MGVIARHRMIKLAWEERTLLAKRHLLRALGSRRRSTIARLFGRLFLFALASELRLDLSRFLNRRAGLIFVGSEMVGISIGGKADERVDDLSLATVGGKCVEHHRAHHAFDSFVPVAGSRSLRKRPIRGGFNGWRQHFNLLSKMECHDEAASSDILHGQPVSGDMGSLAARGVDEFDWTQV